MPELPEVETIKLGLEKLLIGKIIIKVIVSDNSLKSFPNNQFDVNKFMLNARIVALRRRAKILIIELSTAYSLVIHLKMTGQLVFVDGKYRFGAGHPNDSLVNRLPDNSTRISIKFKDEGVLYFNDQRKFGWIKLLPTTILNDKDFFRHHGPEPLQKNFTSYVFKNRLLKHKNTMLKAALLNQSIIAGIGNIYADESLWLAKLHPKSVISNLNDKDFVRLHRAILEVLNLSLRAGGSTDKNYVDAYGNKGNYLKFANVFRREGQLCPQCGEPIIKIRVASRGTHICLNCQILK